MRTNSVLTTTALAGGTDPPLAAADPVNDRDLVDSEGNRLPAVLDRHIVEQYRQQFLNEFHPIGPTETAIVGDLAQRAAAMERWGEAAAAAARQAARGLPELLRTARHDVPISRDAVLAAAMTADGPDRCDRHSLGHARAFYRALQKLEEIRAKRKKHETAAAVARPSPFADEAACEAYLADRFRSGQHRCRQCGAMDGYFYPARRSWECRRCHAQVGLRSGTVMARSPIPLCQWFEAIRWLLLRPTIRTTELATRTGIRRPTTVRAVARKIRQAMAEDDASDRLAGLDIFFTACPPNLS